MDNARIERELRFLKGYAVLMTLAVSALAVGACAASQRSTQQASAPRSGKVRFEEIDVERINIVEPDGKYRLVLSNRPRSIGPIYMGKPFGYEGGGRPGMIWFNDEGTENGGFTFTGSKCETGTSPVTGQPCTKGTYVASTHFTFDQFDQDQIFVMNYNDQNGLKRAGITISDRKQENIYDLVMRRDSIMKIADSTQRMAALTAFAASPPDDPRYAERLYIGRDPAKSAIVNLRDKSGKTRLRMLVDSLGAARIEFLDADGRVTNSVTGAR